MSLQLCIMDNYADLVDQIIGNLLYIFNEKLISSRTTIRINLENGEGRVLLFEIRQHGNPIE
jgi:hypothetical protein